VVHLQDREVVHLTISPCGESLANLSGLWFEAAPESGAARAGGWIAV
jgi:hypothetical protein